MHAATLLHARWIRLRPPITVIAVLVLSIMLVFSGSFQIPTRAHALPPTGANLVGISCAYGTTDPVTGATFTGRDGNGTIERSCQWAGDADLDGPTPEAGAEPMVEDSAPGNPYTSCGAAPCLASPGGGGFEADIVVANLNDYIIGFDLNISYNVHVLNAVVIDQAGLEFGGNVGCSSCTVTLADTIDNIEGHVRVAQTLLGTSAMNGTLFRIRFDVVGAGSSGLIIGGADVVTHNVASQAKPLSHTDIQGSFSTDYFYNAINGCPTSPNCTTTGLGFNASWTYSPNPAVPGSPITFTASAACTNCTGTLRYSWAWNTGEGTPPTVQATGQTVTVGAPFPVIRRVTLIVQDSASTTHNNVTATRILPLSAMIHGSNTISTGSSSGWTGWWMGGVSPYTFVQFGLCPAVATTPKVCSNPTVTFPTPTSLQNDTISGITYSFSGLYQLKFSVSDNSPIWVTAATGITLTTINPAVVSYFALNVTGSNDVFAVSASTNTTATDTGRGVGVSAMIVYNPNYPSTARVAIFTYTAYFGDGTSASSSGNLSGPSTAFADNYTTPGTYTIRITAQEVQGSGIKGVSRITETAYTTVTIAARPAARFTLTPSAPTGGQSIAFTGSVTAGTGPYTYAWNFGDGTTTGNETSPSHTYSSSGSYNVTLTITDSSGVATHYSQVVTVTNSPMSAFPWIYVIIGVVAVAAAVTALLVLKRKRQSSTPMLPPS